MHVKFLLLTPVAQAKLKADAEMARMEQELRAAEAARLGMRKQTLAQHRLRLQDRNKQQALTRIFEQNFGEVRIIGCNHAR